VWGGVEGREEGRKGGREEGSFQLVMPRGLPNNLQEVPLVMPLLVEEGG
jgi:hypothetical protein